MLTKNIKLQLENCKNKFSYRTEEMALRTAKLRRREGKVRLRVYKCEICGGWHLTKKGVL